MGRIRISLREVGPLLVLLPLVLACSLLTDLLNTSEAQPSVTPPPVATETLEAPQTATQTAAAEQPSATVVHLIQPSEPGPNASSMTDVRSASAAARRGITAGDSYAHNLLERPFTAGDMEYQAHLDITGASLVVDGTWFYFTIELEARSTNPSDSTVYAIEVDSDRDGRGDWLVAAQTPLEMNWSTLGVRAWQDGNGDVGGVRPMSIDGRAAGDGYEVVRFDQGQGVDPDLAWARELPGGRPGLQVALKRDQLGVSGGFMWSAWAIADEFDPGRFDFHDRMDEVAAGSPLVGNSNYPLDGLALLDNTCRLHSGFSPSGSEPGLCPLPATPTPPATATPTATPTPETGVIYGLVWVDFDLDGNKDSGEPPLDDQEVIIAKGMCGSETDPILIITSFIEYGTNFYQANLAPGTYCVSTGYSATPSTTGGSPVQVELSPGGQVYVEFGFRGNG